MTHWLAGAWDSPAERTHRVVAAGLRAAYAWTVRRERPDAMREVARMTGVVMEAHGPGRGPMTPLDLIASLRVPLGRIPAVEDTNDDVISQVVLLDEEDRLTSDAYDLACEYALPVGGLPEWDQWMPRWTWMRADQIRGETFIALIEGNGQDNYVASRRFLIENPAGSLAELSERISETGARPPRRGYTEIPADQLHRSPGGDWWWPCPACGWPMAVSGRKVRCRYRPHAAVYELSEGKKETSRPTLHQIDEGPRVTRPVARPGDGSRCLEFGVWRFVVVPGVSELRVMRKVEKEGAAVRLWPEFDEYDLLVLAGDDEFKIDVKEYQSVHRLIADLRAKPPRARVLLPKTHESQIETLTTALPSLRVVSETKFYTEVKRALARKA